MLGHCAALVDSGITVLSKYRYDLVQFAPKIGTKTTHQKKNRTVCMIYDLVRDTRAMGCNSANITAAY